MGPICVYKVSDAMVPVAKPYPSTHIFTRLVELAREHISAGAPVFMRFSADNMYFEYFVGVPTEKMRHVDEKKFSAFAKAVRTDTTIKNYLEQSP